MSRPLRTLWTIAAVLTAAAHVSLAQTPNNADWVTIGDSKATVIQRMGWPTGVSVKDQREVLSYPQGQVLLENGRVTQVFGVKNAPPLATRPSPAISQVPRPARSSQPLQSPPQPTPGRPTSQPQAQPLPPTLPPPAPPDLTGFILAAIWFPLVVLGGISLIGTLAFAAFARSKTKSKKRPVPPRSAPALPVAQATPPALPQPDQFNTAARLESLPVDPTAITPEMIDALEWKRVEELAAAYFLREGYRAEETPFGPDGGVDVVLYRESDTKPAALVQCKAWHGVKVGVQPVRELFGVMAAQRVDRGYFVATGSFSSDAIAFASGTSLSLIDGRSLHSQLQYLSPQARAEIRSHIWRDDYQTPTCPSCGVKMIRRESAQPFWGCINYPRCRSTIPMRAIHR